MSCNRESIYTLLASDINKFADHKSTKRDLYDSVVALIEMSTEEERNDRLTYKKHVQDAGDDIVAFNNIPYSNWWNGQRMVE